MDGARAKAAAFLAEDELADQEICELLGVDRRTIDSLIVPDLFMVKLILSQKVGGPLAGLRSLEPLSFRATRKNPTKNGDS
jgi:hypothetical protein